VSIRRERVIRAIDLATRLEITDPETMSDADWRKLSDEVLVAAGWESGGLHGGLLFWYSPATGHAFEDGQQPDPARDLNAIVALVPEGYEVTMNFGTVDGKPYADARLGRDILGEDDWPRAAAATPALALSAALVRAAGTGEG